MDTENLKHLEGHKQDYDDYTYNVIDLIREAEKLKVITLKVSDIFLYYDSPSYDTFTSFVKHCEKVYNSNLKYPIILSPGNFILDGKHRLAKAIISNHETISAVRFEEMPLCGELIKDE